MTDTTLDGVVSERDARLRERAAYLAGCERWNGMALVSTIRAQIEDEARQRYPIRKKVPRVARHRAFYARAGDFNGDLAVRFYFDPACERPHTPNVFSADLVATCQDLLARPYDEVDE
jgi:hypothetical protein